MNPSISIVTPLYNRENLVGQTIESVLQQSMDDWELLVVDDHSSDNSLAVVERFQKSDARVRVWSRKSDVKGAPACRNEGLAESKGSWVIFLDSDDLLGPNCLANRLDACSESEGYDFQIFPSEQFRKTPGDLKLPWYVKTVDPLTGFLRRPIWQTTAAIWNRNAIEQLNGFREDLLAWQDWDLFVRALISDQKFIAHDDSAPDNFIRRSIHDRISLHAARSKKSLRNRILLFRDLHQQLSGSKLLNEEREVALRNLYVKLATQMHIAKISDEADQWIAELPSFNLISAEEVPQTQRLARENSRMSLRQHINEWKVTLLRMTRNGFGFGGKS